MQGRSNRFKGTGGCRALCCTSCRTSTESGESSGSSDRYASISSLAHHMVQERLDQMIKENEEEQARRLMEARKRKQKKVVKNVTTSPSSRSSSSNRKLLLMLAMEKSSHDPREDFRRSMVEVILANRIKEPNDLRYLLKCYISINSVEYRGIILEAFYQQEQTDSCSIFNENQYFMLPALAAYNTVSLNIINHLVEFGVVLPAMEEGWSSSFKHKSN